CRLRLIFSNGTESNLLLRSLQRAFYNDPAARRLASPESGQLSFGGELEADDVESGTIYVLRSLSDHPYVAQHRDIIHKMGVTGGRVETRIANAEHDSTYLLAKVEVVAT
ncbi:GIY-YIG nuclease family protein, partial [Pseudomonas aeruginosa]